MTNWLYLTFGLALFFNLLPREVGFKKRIWIRTLQLELGLALVLTIDALSNYILWNASGRTDLRLFSLFFWTLLINQWTLCGKAKEKTKIELLPNPSFIALLGFAVWTVAETDGLGFGKQFIYGASLPAGSAVIEWLLAGLVDRARLSQVPIALQGEPILFWITALLFFALAGFRWLGILAGVG